MAAACTDDSLVTVPANNGTSDVKMITETISATNGDASSTTRVDIGNGNNEFSWTVGDNIAVHVSNGDSHKYVFTSDDGASGASVAAATASFTVTYPEGYARDAFAVFPASIVATDAEHYGQESHTLDVTLPSSYTLAQVSGTTTPCPMIADNTSDSWTFKQLCGMLRLTVNSIPSDATGMIIQFPGKKVNGTFSVASPVTAGTSTIATDTPADGEDKITVTFATGTTEATVNIPLPTGDYKYVYVTSVGSTTKMAALQEIKAGGYTAARAHGKKLTTTMAVLPVVTRSDGGDVDELEPAVFTDELWYDFHSNNGNPIEITINGNSENVRFYFNDDPAVVTLTGSGDPVSATWTGQNAFIESNDDLTVILDCNYVIDNSANYEKAIECSETGDATGGALKLATTGSTQTLTVITNDDGSFAKGIFGDSNFNEWTATDVANLAADGFIVSLSDDSPIDNGGGTYKWVYTVAPVTPDPSYKIKFTYNNGTEQTELTNLRFVRIFSCKNKLHNGETTYGPFTMSSDTNLDSPITADLTFDSNDGDQIVFQVVDADGNVYSALTDAPLSKNATVEVTRYTFTVASGKKVCFSPGDLGKDGDVYSFTEPFTDWAGTTTAVTTVPSKRSWFNYDEVDANTDPATSLYGITWRCENYVSSAYEWNNIIGRTMNSEVSPYYKVTVNGHANCLLLPPNEAISEDIGSDIKSGTVGADYVKYLGKGFVLLMNAKRGTYNGTKKTISWSSTDYAYWSLRDSKNRYYLVWTSSANPEASFAGSQFRMHVRLIHDVN